METILPTVKQEAIALLSGLGPNDEVSLVSFASDVRLHSDWLKADRAATIISNLKPEPHAAPLSPSIGVPGFRVGDSNTYLYEALRYVFDTFRAPTDRIAVFLFSDGIDTGGGRGIDGINARDNDAGKSLRRFAQESWAIMYPIRYRTEQAIPKVPEASWRPLKVGIHIGSGPADPRPKVFDQIVVSTGGVIFDWTTRRDLTVAIASTLADLRSQYSIAYEPLQNSSKGYKRIKVRVKKRDLVVRTRDGYFNN